MVGSVGVRSGGAFLGAWFARFGFPGWHGWAKRTSRFRLEALERWGACLLDLFTEP